jgi:uncharacterized protein (DUF2141 family)
MTVTWRSIAGLGVALLAAQIGGDARADTPKVSLTVSFEGFRNTTGQALVAIFDAQEAWPKLARALRLEKLKLTGPRLDYTFRDLAPGTYAVSVVHDENENGKLDMKWLPYPHPGEGVGASNDAAATMGPPSWSDARFGLSDKGGVMTIHLRYY